jgi:hypothetical protein
MLNRPPLVDTILTPQEIIGWDNLSSFALHVKNYNPTNKPNTQMAEIIKRLNANGYYPNGVDDHGKIIFLCPVRSEFMDMFEGEELERIKRMPLDDMMQHARGGFRKIMGKMEDPFKIDEWSADAESYDNQDYAR